MCVYYQKNSIRENMMEVLRYETNMAGWNNVFAVCIDCM